MHSDLFLPVLVGWLEAKLLFGKVLREDLGVLWGFGLAVVLQRPSGSRPPPPHSASVLPHLRTQVKQCPGALFTLLSWLGPGTLKRITSLPFSCSYYQCCSCSSTQVDTFSDLAVDFLFSQWLVTLDAFSFLILEEWNPKPLCPALKAFIWHRLMSKMKIPTQFQLGWVFIMVI